MVLLSLAVVVGGQSQAQASSATVAAGGDTRLVLTSRLPRGSPLAPAEASSQPACLPPLLRDSLLAAFGDALCGLPLREADSFYT